MRIVRLSILFTVMGWLLFYAVADFTKQSWCAGYFLWDKAKDTLLLMSIAAIATKYRNTCLTAVVFAGIRLTWEAICLVFGEDKNGTIAVNILYGVVIILFLYHLKKDINHAT